MEFLSEKSTKKNKTIIKTEIIFSTCLLCEQITVLGRCFNAWLQLSEPQSYLYYTVINEWVIPENIHALPLKASQNSKGEVGSNGLEFQEHGGGRGGGSMEWNSECMGDSTDWSSESTTVQFHKASLNWDPMLTHEEERQTKHRLVQC